MVTLFYNTQLELSRINEIKNGDKDVLGGLAELADTNLKKFLFTQARFRKEVINDHGKTFLEENNMEGSVQALIDFINRLIFLKANGLDKIKLSLFYDRSRSIKKFQLTKWSNFIYQNDKGLENLYWEETKSIEEVKVIEPKTVTDDFFISCKKQLLENTEILRKYSGSYRLIAIKNPKLGQNDKKSIISKLVHITQNKNNTFEVVEDNIDYKSKGVVYNTGDYITMSTLDYEEDGSIQDIFLTLMPFSKTQKYGDNAVFFHAAELVVDYNENPTFRYVILQKISSNQLEYYNPKIYSFDDLDKLIAAEPNEHLRPELEKIILNLLYKHKLGQAQINIKYKPNTKSLLNNIEAYDRNLTFADNVKKILNLKNQKPSLETSTLEDNNSFFDQIQSFNKDIAVKSGNLFTNNYKKFCGIYYSYFYAVTMNKFIIKPFYLLHNKSSHTLDVCDGYLKSDYQSVGWASFVNNNIIIQLLDMDKNDIKKISKSVEEPRMMYINLPSFHNEERIILRGLELGQGMKTLPASRRMIFRRFTQGDHSKIFTTDDDLSFFEELPFFIIDPTEEEFLKSQVSLKDYFENGNKKVFDIENDNIFTGLNDKRNMMMCIDDLIIDFTSFVLPKEQRLIRKIQFGESE